MRTSDPGSSAGMKPAARRGAGLSISARRRAGFTLIELMVVVAIIAVGAAGVLFALRDDGGARLDREAQRLSALFESARAQSRSSGMPVVWHAMPGGFRFEGLPNAQLPDRWLDDTTVVQDGGR